MKYSFKFTKSFKKDLRKLHPETRKKFLKKFKDYFLNNPWHPSFNTHQIKKERNIWACEISDKYRFTFKIEGNVIILQRIGTHQIYRL